MEKCTRDFIDGITDPIIRNQIIEKCSEGYRVLSYLRLHYGILEQSDVLTSLLSIAVIGIALMGLRLVSDEHFSGSIGRLSSFFRLTPSLSAATLIAISSGTRDLLFSAAGEAAEETPGVVLGFLVAGFVFSSTLIVGNVLHRSHSRKLRVPKAPFIKELSTYGFTIGLLFFWGSVGSIGSFWVFVYFALYITYLIASFMLREESRDEIIAEKIQETFSGEDLISKEEVIQSLAHSSPSGENRFKRSSFLLRKSVWNFEDSKPLNVILMPLRAAFVVSIPNENLFASTEKSPAVKAFIYLIKLLSSSISLFTALKFLTSLNGLLCLYISLAPPLFIIVSSISSRLAPIEARLLLALNFVGSLGVAQLFAGFAIDSITSFGFIFEWDRWFMNTIILSAANSLMDYFLLGALSDMGNETMAYLSGFASQTFKLLAVFFVHLLRRKSDDFDVFGFQSPALTNEHFGLRSIFAFGGFSVVAHSFVAFSFWFSFPSGYKIVLFFLYFLFFMFCLVNVLIRYSY